MLGSAVFDFPLHPILVNFTAALVPVSVASDWMGRLSKKSSLASVGLWTLLYAAIITPATAFAGWWWMRSMPDMDHWEMNIHMWLGISVATILPLLLFWRGRSYRHGTPASFGYLATASALVLALVVQGHLGGMMSFGQDESAPSGHMTDHDTEPSGGAHEASSASRPGPLQWREQIDLKNLPDKQVMPEKKDAPDMKEMHHDH